MNLRFFNHFGGGDLIESKAFVLEWLRLAKVETAEYACQPRFHPIFEDVPQIRCVPLNEHGRGAWLDSGITHVNTWIGQNGYRGEPGSYVLHPGVGCVLENNYRLHNALLCKAGLPQLPGAPADYLPRIDYARVPLAQTLHDYLQENSRRKLVLICNGKTTSKHASNHDYHPMLEHLPETDTVRYLFTERVPVNRRDVAFTDDLTQRQTLSPHPGFDLNAISFLSRFCHVMVGRCSGPHIFCQVRDNWLEPLKTLVCFTHYRNGACFVRYPESIGLQMRVRWSAATDTRSAADVIRDVLTAPAGDPRLFHASEVHRAGMDARKRHAQDSWKALYAQGVIPAHLSLYPRSAHAIGDRRDLPYLKDVLQSAIEQANDQDIIFLTNDDIWLHPELPEVLRSHVLKYGPVCSQRCEFIKRPIPPADTAPAEFAKVSHAHPGRDLFAFTKRWLLSQWQDIPDLILGASEWDTLLAALIRLEYGIVTTAKNIWESIPPGELPLGYVAHQYHPPAWQRREIINKAPSQLHNRKLLMNFVAKHNLPIWFGPFKTPVWNRT